ncbi:hypothetical protein FOA52_010466 [Chlamydomonas sp. UWO 241]|nr:hypothetical protein FOA52_010466 [Chlamydomonas sp. UWO 241]
MTEATATLLHGCTEFTIQPRGGCMHIKGKGQMTTYYLKRPLPSLVGGDAPDAQQGCSEHVPAPMGEGAPSVGDPSMLDGMCCGAYKRKPRAAELPQASGSTTMPHARPHSTLYTRAHSMRHIPHPPRAAALESEVPSADPSGADEVDAAHYGMPRLRCHSATQTSGPSELTGMPLPPWRTDTVLLPAILDSDASATASPRAPSLSATDGSPPSGHMGAWPSRSHVASDAFSLPLACAGPLRVFNASGSVSRARANLGAGDPTAARVDGGSGGARAAAAGYLMGPSTRKPLELSG